MKTVVISLGGSVLVPDIANNNIIKYRDLLISLKDTCQIFIVVGGGGEARRYIGAARDLNIDEGTADEIGILITRLNARLLMHALGKESYPDIPESYNDALIAGESGKIVIMGGVTPAQTTDAVAAVLAERAGADLLINATAVDGIYTADPRKDASAMKIPYLTPDELIEIVQKGRMDAGSNNVIDLVAAKVIQRSKIPMVVLDGRYPDGLLALIKTGSKTGSLVSYNPDQTEF
ncbi:UMP kinase [Methanogenium organophilum]|uniref:Uridylate kinase n=1 Tax=Methanogenium organophilum TaxID=2199 RepID=A0A9X9S478_METOG|nr:UMP kinase [Methanogenium organophilum]WAI01185.1 UMP kinase [Methanogenium organophilum]